MYRIVQRALYILLALSVALFGIGYYQTRVLRDPDGPTITMEGESFTVSVGDKDESLLRGIHAQDRKDGDVTSSLVIQGLSNFVEKGRRQATIAAFDSDNNVTKVTREIRYSDYVSPRFSLEHPLSFPIGTQESQIVGAIHVQDCLDGDLSGEVTVELEDQDAWLDTSLEGTICLVYTVVNSAGDVAELPVTVQIYQNSQYSRATQLQLSSNLVYLERGASFDPWSYVSGMEKGGEKIPLNRQLVKVSDPVDTSTPGVYEVLYTVTEEDSENVTRLRLPVIVE